ncbi:Cleavage/polyadenylation specificity factor subunit 5 [Catenaria anguillulae PL171]|uniref:Cleavage and polyadenylation specificity factor subunit 5 n=1 Tax=Catenaria anguillulae PL171 TaxID=765915 RepID=A0A1Y2H4Y0_9FUNG|nr:Cleavage/polyadenylation specificity factor subunit 5 [Catenaria anguillulae PL171]
MEPKANAALKPPFESKVTLAPLSSLRFAQKDEQHEEDTSVTARLERLQRQFDAQGMRTTVEAVIVVHAHNHPHVLLIQIANSFFKLPGDYLKPGEDLVSGLKAKLNQQLSRVVGTDPSTNEPVYEGGDDWDVVECVGQWWRPNFETFLYPYLPPHITRPKENKKIFLVNVPPGRTLWIPRNLKVMAVPVFELAENSSRFGNQISAIPHLLSRFSLECA